MAEHDIIQKMIFQLGQSQDQRLAKELASHFADVDERTPETQLLFAKKFAEFVKYYRGTISTPAGTWKNFFDFDETTVRQLLESNDAKTSPHLALFLAFLELYKTPQEIINRITGRHLAFYYEDVLRLQKKAAIPDKAHVIVELKKSAPPISIVPHKDLFSAGKDKTGVELLYNPTSETIINTSKVDSLRSLFWDKSGHGTVKYAPVANSSDGTGGKLPEAEPKWQAFGQAGLPLAEVGFAIASPVLRMQEGIRKVTVTLTLNNVDAARLNDAALAGAFDVFITGEMNWFGPYHVSPKLSGANVLQFDFQIPETEKAVVDYSAAIHGYAYTAAAPVLQVLLKAGSANIGYNDFRNVVLQKAAVTVDVSNVTSLKLESDGGALDPKKAFLPFGPQPASGSRFLVGYDEALSKKLSELNVKVQWKDAPANFSTYYGGYGVPVSNDYFTASVAFKDGGSWQFSGTGQKLFQHSNASSEMNFTFTPGSSSVSPGMTEGRKVFALSSAGNLWSAKAASRYVLAQPIFLSFRRNVPEAVKGFITLVLERNFLHATYRKKYVENVMTYSRNGGTLTMLNEPYTPAIQSISLSYKAHSDEVNIASISPRMNHSLVC